MVEQLVGGSKLEDFELIKSLSKVGWPKYFWLNNRASAVFSIWSLKVIHPSHAEDATFIDH